MTQPCRRGCGGAATLQRGGAGGPGDWASKFCEARLAWCVAGVGGCGQECVALYVREVAVANAGAGVVFVLEATVYSGDCWW